ncbi:hypothetical protein HYFRA_00013097 [Hymenoscyphus fraxineus]|uniref:Glycosyltransferase family 4 protein n=1 Tax=Hymenoscyphus fraxineus TaxID=746836 RepID=A0A9N9L889_9HELO|nr:hypothetical protein HYFRA_00013097 [Hymenoscyphus fraxineus]
MSSEHVHSWRDNILGVEIDGWDDMIHDWWDLFLAGLTLATLLLGLGYFIYLIVGRVKAYLATRHAITRLPKEVSQLFSELSKNNQLRFPSSEIKVGPAPRSFGVFTGSLTNPPTELQQRLLSKWDILILNPLSSGVLEAISSATSKEIIGRLDVGTLVDVKRSLEPAKLVPSLKAFNDLLVSSFKRPRDSQSPFTGALLANGQQHFPPIIFNELVRYIHSLGLDVYLEVAPPTFLSASECRDINFSLFKGLVCRNGTIMPNGERRNYFQMADMRLPLRALAAQTTGATVMMWESVDNHVELDHAVVTRSYNWCRFSSALSWIGHNIATLDADYAEAHTVVGEPLGAMMWLKSENIMEAQKIWNANDRISPEAVGDHEIYSSLEEFIPELSDMLALVSSKQEHGRNMSDTTKSTVSTDSGNFEWPWRDYNSPANAIQLHSSSHEMDGTGLGCFQLGIVASPTAFTDLVQTQNRLKDLGMLDCLEAGELNRMADQLQNLYDDQSFLDISFEDSQAIKDLMRLLAANKGDDNDRLRIYVGLDSGFRTSSDAAFCQFWGLYDYDAVAARMNIFISGRTKDRLGTILHTFMSSKDCSRVQCFMAEITLSDRLSTLPESWALSPRIVQDLEQLTPAETILFMQRMEYSCLKDYPMLAANIRSCCEYQLLEVPSLSQLKALNATSYIENKISAEDLVQSRLRWYRDNHCDCPDSAAAIRLFKEMEPRVSSILLGRQAEFIDKLDIILETVLQRHQIDASADIFALSIFCAFRKLAINEIFMEIMDRNPLPNPQPDQAACYAEMFALGSGCEGYLGMTPNAVGKILSDRLFAYYQINQPPQRDDTTTEQPTAYAAKLTDINPKYGDTPLMPWYHRITFLGIFAIPAFIDIMLLTTLGRGLYLTTFMSNEEKEMATIALMVALFLCGATGTWVATGGSYYLYSMTFPAMNMFVITRFIAGFAICFTTGILALIIVGVTKGFYAGFVFFAYYLLLNTYLVLLATLSIYQFPGFAFQSGRTVVISRIPILLFSPIVTIWTNHDFLVYIIVLTVFVLSLLHGARGVMSDWSTWYLDIPCMTDIEVMNWYNELKSSRSNLSEKPSHEDIKPTESSLPRRALHAAVLKEHTRPFWNRQDKSTDERIVKMAKGYKATMFLMDWYCKYSRSKMPYAYSPTWNLQCKTAIETLWDMQKGVKLHNAFVHWRNAGNELWGGALYFALALLDKWISIFTGRPIVGLSNAQNERYRLAVGLGLGYYLIGAVFLDGVSQPLWALSQKRIAQPIRSFKSLQEVNLNNAKSRKRLYWEYLTKFFFMHITGLSLTSGLLWSFTNSSSSTILYIAYITAYAGLLCYQYNRIFTGPLAFKEPGAAVIIGLVVGLVLHGVVPTFEFSSVIALGIATWIAAILSFFHVHLGKPNSKNTGLHKPKAIHSSTAIAPHMQQSQASLSEMVDSFSALSDELRFKLDPETHPGIEVMEILISRSKHSQPKIVTDAFPNADQLVHRTVELWKSGEIVIELVPMRHFLRQEQKLKTVSRDTNGRLQVFVFLGLDLIDREWVMDIRRNCKVVAEAIIQATCEARLGLSHDHSMLAELLAVENNGEELALPEGVKRQLQNSTSERTRVVKSGDRCLLEYLLLGVDPDIQWDTLPLHMRKFLLKRACGEHYHVSNEHVDWMKQNLGGGQSLDIDEYVARCNLGAAVTMLTNEFATLLEGDFTHLDLQEPLDATYDMNPNFALPQSIDERETKLSTFFKRPLTRLRHAMTHSTKFLSVALVADPEFARELEYVMYGKPALVRWIVTSFLTSVWLFCKTLQKIILPHVLLHNREGISKLYREMKGINTVIGRNKIDVESLNGPSTCFFNTLPDGSSELHQYSGVLKENPKGTWNLMAINTYSGEMVLRRREEYSKEQRTNVFEYKYHDDKKSRSKVPLARECVNGPLQGQIVHYDKRGYITSGSYVKDGNLTQFKFFYRKHAKHEDELLRAEFELAHIKIQVAWSAPPAKNPQKLDKWIPYIKVTEATFTDVTNVDEHRVYRCRWTYEHKHHPTISTTLDGVEVETPPMIRHDFFKVLQKPQNCSFVTENPLFLFKSAQSSFLERLLSLNRKHYPISTSRARTHLWKAWKSGKKLDAVTARWLDERSLRSDHDLSPYWIARDTSRLDKATDYLESRMDTIMARVDIESDISSWTPLAYKMSDMFTFGQGGDARINTRSQASQMRDTEDELHVLAFDTGTWPNEGGGVSACRRDMVNNLNSIRWHIVAENANDFGVPKFQIEKNVQSLTVLPLWGMDFLTPTHGIFQNILDSEVQRKSHDTRDDDIRKQFIPILKTLVRGARAIKIDRQMMEETTKALVDLNTYFESGRHWGDVWLSPIVKQAWQELWLAENVENARPIEEWLHAECPTLLHLDYALDMWHRYLFVFSIPIPEKIPDIIQASHHFAGASYGIVCKVKRNVAFHVWDHCISWREVTVFLSSAISLDAPFVGNSLIGLSRLTSLLTLHHADVVLPCADFFNPGWEIEIGTQEGTVEHRRSFKRKIDPVVNGICNMESFKPIEKIKSTVPTVVMLSHVRFVKDIKTAILAADIIVNEWGFTDYHLHIYGDMEKAPGYSVECQEIIASKSLGEKVILKGLGSPSQVLEHAWLFLNSSVSEGLPLAMGEAALTGVPVVCTDVGASFRVVTDPVTFKKFSAVVAPNDAQSLARAQINVLGLLDEWSKYAEDKPGFRPKLALEPTKEEVMAIQARMYEKAEHRRRLGMMGRTNVLNSFSEGRYLKEHEQLLWIGKNQAPAYRARRGLTSYGRANFGSRFSNCPSMFNSAPASSRSSFRVSKYQSQAMAHRSGVPSGGSSLRGGTSLRAPRMAGYTKSYASSVTMLGDR